MRTTRRRFLGLLSALPLLELLPGRSTASPTSAYQLQTFFIAGFQHHDGPQLVEQMREGDRLTLVTEPNNEYDDHAVRVEFQGRHVGYVPRDQNRHVFTLLEQNAPLRCEVAAADPHARPWKMVQARIVLESPEHPIRST